MKRAFKKDRNYLLTRLAYLLVILLFSDYSFSQLVAWNPTGLGSYGPSPWTATSSNTNLTVGGLTRGSGLLLSGTSATNAWGAVNWNGGANDDVTFTITANSGYQVSFSSFNLSYRRSSTAPATGSLDYTFGGSSTSYTTIGSFSFTSTSSSGATHSPISLTGISNLQNVPSGTVVKFRILPAAGTSTAGTWYVYTTNGLSISGSVTASSSFSASIAQTASIQCHGQTAGALTASVTGSTPPYTYSWSPAGGTSSVATGLAAGIYSCLISSSTTETTSATFTLTEPSTLSLAVSALSVTCHGGTNGSASVVANGGTPGYSYSWIPTGGSSSVAANIPAGNYTINVSDSKSCNASQTISISEPLTSPTVAANTSNTVICNGSTITLTGSGATTYSWSNGVTNGIPFSPSTTTNYTVEGTDMNGCHAYASISITVNPTPTIIANSGAICPGNAFILTPGGASTYTFSSGSATVTPSSTSTYSIYGTSAEGCDASSPVIATVAVAPSLTVTISGTTSICYGDAVNLTAGGANTYSWSTGDNTYTIAPTPSVNTTYSVIGSSGTCSNTAITTVTVNTLPTISISGSSVICSGQTATFTAGGGSSYLWSTAATGSLITDAPVSNITYSVAGTDNNGCSNFATKSVTVNPIPTITVANGTICSGSSFTINPNGASTYTFSGAQVVTPTITSTYSVSGTNSFGCVSPSMATCTITVNPLASITVNNGTVCAGLVFTIIPSGASSYTFSNGSSTVIPTTNSTYSVTGTNSYGCVSSSPALASVTVNPLPVISVNNGTVCTGGTFSMIPGGANSYTYSNGSSTVIPTVNSSYSVMGTSSLGCVSSSPAIASVTVNPLPTITVNSGTVCSGSAFTIVPGGAATYTLSGGSAIVSPTATTAYFVSGTSSLGCVSSSAAISNVTVISLPLISMANGTICTGSSFTLVPSGALTYTFSSGQVVTPTVTTSYSVTGTSSVGCVSSSPAISTVTVYSLPTISISASSSVCNGSPMNLTASGASTYTWNTGSNSATISVTPSVSIVYSVSGKNSNGCLSYTSNSVTVNPTPTITISGGAICPGGTFTLNPSGASTYTFSSGPVVSPSVTTTYSVSGTSSLGCTSLSQAIAVVTVTNSLIVSISGSSVICNGQTANIIASGASNYTWSNGAQTFSIAPTPSVSINYSVTGASGTCSNAATFSVNVLSVPIISVVASNSAVCSGQQVTLTAGGANTYTWTNGVTNGNPFTPSVTSIYSVTGTATNGCTGSNTLAIIVNTNPVVTATASALSVCSGATLILTGLGANNYTWSSGMVNGQAFTPSVTTTFTVYGTDANGCNGSDALSVTVKPNPTITAVSNGSLICMGETATITAGGASTFTWNTSATASIIVVNPSVTTSYTVTGEGSNGCVSTATVQQNVSTCTGFDLSGGNDILLLQVYPNPNTGSFVIKTNLKETIPISNELGMIVQSIHSGDFINDEVQIKDLNAGIYFISLSGKNIRKEKIIVTK